MDDRKSHLITGLLHAWSDGDQEALTQLEPLVRQALRTTAKHMLAGEWKNRTLCTTELVNEAWLRLLSAEQLNINDRRHFYCLSARIMKHFLMNRAQARNAKKRKDWMGRNVVMVYPENLDLIWGEHPSRMEDLSLALDELGRQDARKERVVTLFCFGGFTREEIADIEQVSLSKIKRELQFSFAWLRQNLGDAIHENKRLAAHTRSV